MRAHLDFADGTSAWVDFGDFLPPLPRWGFGITDDGKTCYAFDREKQFPNIIMSPDRSQDVAEGAVVVAALNRLYPRPEGRTYR